MMVNMVLYISLGIASVSLLLALIAVARVGQINKSIKDLDWSDVANLTGDIATVKKTIQTLNNRMNGMNSPRVAEHELLAQLAQNQQIQQTNGKLGG